MPLDCVVAPSHPVLGKPVRIRRCPATVSGDDGPLRHRNRGKAGRSANPKPGDRPENLADCLPRGGWLRGLSAPMPCFRVCGARASVRCCPPPPLWISPHHEGGYANRAIIACTFVFARLAAEFRNFPPLWFARTDADSRGEFQYDNRKFERTSYPGGALETLGRATSSTQGQLRLVSAANERHTDSQDTQGASRRRTIQVAADYRGPDADRYARTARPGRRHHFRG